MQVDTNWEFWIVSATALCAVIVLIYRLFGLNKDTAIYDFARSFLPLLLFVVILRSFIAEPFRIPSGSMIPTLEVGDFILVKKFSYGIRLPITHQKIVDIASPKRGDVVVFRYPPQPEVNYIKRLIGLPGDKIRYTSDKKLFINDQLVSSTAIDNYLNSKTSNRSPSVAQFSEQLPDDDNAHNLIIYPGASRLVGEWQVPAGHYFMMGDNRDNSSDGRVWGFVPEANLVGKASLVWMHWNWQKNGDGFQSGRIGTAVN